MPHTLLVPLSMPLTIYDLSRSAHDRTLDYVVDVRVVFSPCRRQLARSLDCARSVGLAATCYLLLAPACMDDSPELAAGFAARTSEPTGLPMPDSHMRDAMPNLNATVERSCSMQQRACRHHGMPRAKTMSRYRKWVASYRIVRAHNLALCAKTPHTKVAEQGDGRMYARRILDLELQCAVL